MPGDLALLLGAPTLVASGRRALPPLADRILLADVARRTDGYFAPVAETPGFGEALYRLVRELRGSGYELDHLAPALEGLTDAPAKAHALAAILTRFEERRSDFYGADDALLAADPARLAGLGLLVWGGLDMAPVLERLLTDIAQWMPVDLYLPSLPHGIDAPVGALAQRLSGGGDQLPADLGRSGSDHPAALERVRRQIFTAPDGGAVAADGTVRLCIGSRPLSRGPCGCASVSRVGGRGDPILGHGDRVSPRGCVSADDRGRFLWSPAIPVYLHEGSPLAQRPIGRQTLALLELFGSNLSRQSVMDFLTDVRLPRALRDEYGYISAARWDALSREAGIVAGADQWQTRTHPHRLRRIR